MLWPRDCVERMIGDYDICGVMSLLGMVVLYTLFVWTNLKSQSQLASAEARILIPSLNALIITAKYAATKERRNS